MIAHSFGVTASMLYLSTHPESMPEKLCLISPMRSLANHVTIFNEIAGLSHQVLAQLEARLAKKYALTRENTDITLLAPSVSSKTLIVHDLQDSLIDVCHSELLAECWKQARFIKTRGLGHRQILQDKTSISTVKSFMTKT